MTECYVGEYESQSAYATEFFNQNDLPKIRKGLQLCINYKYIKEDIFMRQGFSIEADAKTHVFGNLK
jgi:hypothetical protein